MRFYLAVAVNAANAAVRAAALNGAPSVVVDVHSPAPGIAPRFTLTVELNRNGQDCAPVRGLGDAQARRHQMTPAARSEARRSAVTPALSSTASVSAPSAGACHVWSRPPGRGRACRDVRIAMHFVRLVDVVRHTSASAKRSSHSAASARAKHRAHGIHDPRTLRLRRVLQRYQVRPLDPLAEACPELRFERAERQPLAVGGFVDVVAAAGEVGGRRKHRPVQRRLVNRHVDRAARPGARALRTAPRGCAIAACIAAPMSPTSGPGSSGGRSRPASAW